MREDSVTFAGPLPIGRIRWGRARRASLVVLAVLSLVASLLMALPAVAAPPWHAPTARPEKEYSTHAVTPRAARRSVTATKAVTGAPSVSWPKAGSASVTLPAAGAASRVKAGRLPVALGAPPKKAKAAGPAVSRAKVTMLGHTASRTAVGTDAVAFTVTRTDDSTRSADVSVQLDYAAFAKAAGGDYGSRLRLVQLPACALTTPTKQGCQDAKVLPTDNNATDQTVTATVAAAPSGTVVAALAGASGASGDYSATSLASSATWQVSPQTGAFTWSYPIDMPAAPFGASPQLALSYNSQAVDGRTAATNNQASWVGDGWDLWSGYVERSYKSCGQDQNDGANNTDKKTGDACWGTDNATISLNGSATTLIKDATSGKWHLQSDDGSRVEHLTGASNGDNDGEYWKVTTNDGTQYFFGRNRLPGWASGDTETKSTWTEPVFGNDPGEDCHATAFSDSSCTQAWRWNLDYVVDTHGNAVSYSYTPETGYYGRASVASDKTSYIRGGWMKEVDYGFTDGHAYDTSAADRVTFTVADRCSPNSTCDTSHTASWPDTPWDQECLASTCTDKYSPVFFTGKMLTTITTQVWSGSKYNDVNTWSLGQSFLDVGDNDADPLWLKSITHTGLNGGTAALPPVTFDGVQLANRVDTSTDGLSALIRYRIKAITTESGGVLTVGYSDPQCKVGTTMPSAPDSDTLLCMPAYWYPPGEDKKLDYFHKYVVKEVRLGDRFGGADDDVTTYDYQDKPAWHYDDNPMVPSSLRTWSQWRGYGKVTVRHGNVDDKTPSLTEYRILRGMDGDKQSDGTTRSVSVTDSQGGTITDTDQLQGFQREQITYNGSAVLTDAINDPWTHGPTATQGSQKAWMVQSGTVNTRAKLADGSWRTTRVTTDYNDDGLATQVDDRGDTTTADDNRCTTTTYNARNTSDWILNRAATVESDAVACGTTPTPVQVLSISRYYYDKAALGASVSTGDITTTEGLVGWDGTTPKFATSTKVSYDTYGRPLATTNALGDTTTTAYTPATGVPVTAVKTTDPLGHATTNTLDLGTGEVTSTVDANGRKTESTYDPLGRVTAVWMPGRTKGTDDPNVKYAYQISSTAASSVTTQTLTYGWQTDATASLFYVTSYQIYDAQLRLRQTQSPSETGGAVVVDTLYDDRGLTKQVSQPYARPEAPSTALRSPDGEAETPAVTQYVYDGAERQTAAIFLVGMDERWRTTTAYPGADRTDVTPPEGASATSAITDARGQTTELRQYHGGTPAGAYDATKYTYTPAGKLATVTDSSGNIWTYGYDPRGYQTSADDPDTGHSTTAYDNAGQVSSTTDARGTTIAYTYDKLGRRTGAFDGTTTGTQLAGWTYDTLPGGLGLPTSSTSYHDGHAYTQAVTGYDTAGRATGSSVTIPDNETGLAGTYSDSYTYNPAGMLASMTVPAVGGLKSEKIQYDYDKLGNLSQLWSALSFYVYGTQFNPSGTVAERRLGPYSSQLVQVYNYELGTQRLTRVTSAPTNKSNVSDLHYTYDDAGEVTTSTDYTGGDLDTQCYRYDYLDRLAEAWTPKAAGSDGLTPGDCTSLPASTSDLGGPAAYWHSYSYDDTGNRTQLVKHIAGGDTTVTSTYPTSGSAQPHTLQSTLTSTSVGDGSTATEQSSFTYDASGHTKTRTIGGDTETLAWNDDGTLDSLTTASGSNTSYIYDATGTLLIRHDPDSSATLYLPDGTQLHTNGAGTTAIRYYTCGSDTVAVRSPTTLTWLVNDPNGTNNVQIDAKTLTATHRYTDPFGDNRSTLPSWIGDRGYAGGVQDSNTGLTLLGAREYDPSLGRFLSADPLLDPGNPQQLNGYAYANNSPVTHADPSGLLLTSNFGSTPSEEFINALVGGTWWQNEVYPLNRAWAADKSVSHGAAANGHRLLDIVGYIPVVGTVADAANAVWYATEGDWTNAAISGGSAALGVLPIGKVVSIGGKLVVKVVIKGAVKAAAPALEKAAAKTAVKTAAKALAKDGAKDVGEAAAKDTGKAVKQAAEAGAEDAGSSAEKVAAGCAHSFPTGTHVELADGSSKPIEDIKIGDKIRNADPDSHHDQTHRVDGIIVTTTDRDLVDITLITPHGPETLTTTRHHRIWDATTHHWAEAASIKSGHRLQTSDGTVAIVGVRHYTRTDTTFDLTINHTHTYYVLAGTTPVLVHNCNWDMTKIDEKYDKHVFGDGKRPGEGPDMPEYQHEVDGLDGFDRYRQDACGLMCGPKTPNVREVIRSGDGAILRLETSTGRLGIMQNGKITNFFRPDNPLAYMENESGR